MAIRWPSERECQPNINPLCFVPRYVAEVVSGSLCPSKIFKGATIQELSAICIFKCIDGDKPQAGKISDFNYVLPHVREAVRLSCRYSRNETLDLTHVRQLGAIEIRVPCDCTLTTDSQILLVSETYPCRRLPEVSTVVHTIPAAWSKLKSLKISTVSSHEVSSFNTLDDCLDERWSSQVPHWNVTLTSPKIARAPVLESLSRDNSLFIKLYAYIDAFSLVLLLIILICYPYLIDLGVPGRLVRAEENVSIVEKEPFIFDFIVALVLIASSVLGTWSVVKYLRQRSKAKPQNIELNGQRSAIRDEDLPHDVLLATIDGRELRVTLEWCDIGTPTKDTPRDE